MGEPLAQNFDILSTGDKTCLPAVAAILNSNLQTLFLTQCGTSLLGFGRSRLLAEFGHDLR